MLSPSGAMALCLGVGHGRRCFLFGVDNISNVIVRFQALHRLGRLESGLGGLAGLFEVAFIGSGGGFGLVQLAGPHQLPSTSKTNLVNTESSPNT